MQDSRIWAASVLNRKRADSRAERTDTRAAMTAEPTAVCDQQTAQDAGRRSRGVQRLGRATDRRPLPARKLVDDYAQFAQTCQDCASGIVDACGPGSPDSHRVVWGLTSRPPVSPRAFLRFPVCPPGSSPSSAVLWFPFARRSPVRSLRPLPGSGSPSVSLRVPFPLSNLHLSAAARRFRRRWSRAAGTNVTSSAATTPRWALSVLLCHLPGLPRTAAGSSSRAWQALPGVVRPLRRGRCWHCCPRSSLLRCRPWRLACGTAISGTCTAWKPAWPHGGAEWTWVLSGERRRVRLA